MADLQIKIIDRVKRRATLMIKMIWRLSIRWKNREEISVLSVKSQITRTLQRKQRLLNDMLLEIAKGTRYELDIKEVVKLMRNVKKTARKVDGSCISIKMQRSVEKIFAQSGQVT